jgi:hypothetical protein
MTELNFLPSTVAFQDLATGEVKSDTTHAQSFEVACTHDRFSLFSLKTTVWNTH